MDMKKAFNLAIKSMKKEKQQLAFDANLVRVLADPNISPLMKKRAEHYAALAEAIKVLEEMRDGKA